MTRKKYSLDRFFNDAKAVLTKRNYLLNDHKLEVQVTAKDHDTLGLKYRFIIRYSNDLEFDKTEEKRHYIFSSGKTPEDCLQYFDSKIIEEFGSNPEDHADYNFSDDFSI